MIAKLKKLNKILTLSKRRVVLVDVTTDTRLVETKKLLPESYMGRTVKLAYAVGQLDLTYHIFGQNQDKPEASGTIDLTDEFVDTLTETSLKEYRGIATAAFLDSVVNKHLKDEGLIE